MSLKKKTVKGLIWSTIDAVGLNVFRILITIVLARLLDPADFGLIAVLNIFIALSEAITKGGFTTALIRRLEVSDKDYSTVFTFNFVLSLLIYFIIYLISPLIADFFNEPSLRSIAKVVALVIVFHAFGLIQNIALRRALNFRALAFVNIVSTVLSGGIGITMAYTGYGVWSLVAQITLKALISTALMWIISKMKVRVGFYQESFKENFNFGYKILLSNIINTLTMNAYNVVIGKLYNTESLGFYYQAKRLSDFSSQIISNVFKSVSFPVLSSIQDDETRLTNAYIQFLRHISFIAFPLMMLLIVVANPLLTMLITDKWLESVPYFQLLCISGMLLPLIVLSGYMPLIKGRSDIFLKMEIFYKSQLMLALIITASFGIKAMIIGMVVQIAIQFFINLTIVSRLYKLSFLFQVGRLKDIFLISFAVSLVTYLLKYVILTNEYLIFVQVFLFTLLYISIQYLIKSKELFEIKNLVTSKILNK